VFYLKLAVRDTRNQYRIIQLEQFASFSTLKRQVKAFAGLDDDDDLSMMYKTIWDKRMEFALGSSDDWAQLVKTIENNATKRTTSPFHAEILLGGDKADEKSKKAKKSKAKVCFNYHAHTFLTCT
jgi:hypothetical protein